MTAETLRERPPIDPLLIRVGQGDIAAFALRRTCSRIVQIAWSLVRDHATADEVACRKSSLMAHAAPISSVRSSSQRSFFSRANAAGAEGVPGAQQQPTVRPRLIGCPAAVAAVAGLPGRRVGGPR
jgi:hypothetical protein